MNAPGFFRRLASLLYDGLLLLALLFLATFGFIALLGSATESPQRYYLQAFLWLVAGIYFVWSWRHGGQTLAMQTWRIRVTDRQGNQPSLRQAVLRYCLASLFFGVSWVWALFDRERLALHDRLAGTQLILSGATARTANPRP